MERSPPLADDLPDGQRSNGHGKSLTKEEDTLLGGEVDCKSRPWGLRGDSNSSSCSPSSSTPNNEFLPLDRSDIKQAASFVLACNKQTQGGLQAWDHADFVRMSDQSVLFQSTWNPLVVLQEAQATAFAFRCEEVSLVNLWHGRQPGGIVLNVNHLGMLRQLRESRLVPFRLGCNCLYDHPAFAHLFKRKPAAEFPVLMHINPSMSGPVRFHKAKNGVIPYCVAFAGAEFVVVGRTIIRDEEHWEVVVELCDFVLDLRKSNDEGPATPGLEGLPEIYLRHGTHQSVGYVAVSTKDMPTLLEGQAPTDIDRFKAWHMDPLYHSISHHVWSLEDVRIFLLAHRFFYIVGPMLALFLRRMPLLGKVACILVAIVLTMRRSECDEALAGFYCSKLGPVGESSIHNFVDFYRLVTRAFETASSIVRMSTVFALSLPDLLLPEKIYTTCCRAIFFVAGLIDYTLRVIVVLYKTAMEAFIGCLTPVRGLARTVRFIDASIGNVCVVVLLLLTGLMTLVSSWFSESDNSPSAQTEAQLRDLLNKTDIKSKVKYVGLVRKIISDMRSRDDLATDRRRRAISKGARQCFGGRASGPFACSAALAVAAVRKNWEPSPAERSTINRILFKSSIVRDSLVRTARVMLLTDPTKAAEEVAHELMHAAEIGVTWPDEYMIGRALQSEGKKPTAENVSWHRAKWIAVAARIIVERESLPSDKHTPSLYVLSEQETGEDIDYRDSDIHPGERCVGCYMPNQQRGHHRSGSGGSKHTWMGTRPPPVSDKLSACKSAIVKDSRRQALRVNYEPVNDICRVLPASSREVNPEAEEFPFFHTAARQPKVDHAHSRRLAARMATIEDTFARLVKGDKASADRASCRAAVQKSSQAQRLVRTNPPQQPQKQQLEYQRQDPSGANCGSISPSTGSAPTKETVAASFKLKKRRCDVMLKREKEKEKQRKTEADKLHRTEEKRRREEERSKTKEQEAAAANRKAAQDERKHRRAKLRKERAAEAESARKQRLRDLASDMHAILNEHPAAGEVKDEASSCSARLEDVSYEDDDDQTLCIVCMTHKRNACLVHGKTSHQVVCVPCGDRLKAAEMSCPMCQRPIDVVVQNFTS